MAGKMNTWLVLGAVAVGVAVVGYYILNRPSNESQPEQTQSANYRYFYADHGSRSYQSEMFRPSSLGYW